MNNPLLSLRHAAVVRQFISNQSFDLLMATPPHSATGSATLLIMSQPNLLLTLAGSTLLTQQGRSHRWQQATLLKLLTVCTIGKLGGRRRYLREQCIRSGITTSMQHCHGGTFLEQVRSRQQSLLQTSKRTLVGNVLKRRLVL
jgi:hypothetical protein